MQASRAPDPPPAAPLEVRGLRIAPPLFLAPMAGLTHVALRHLVAEFGGCGCFETEMLSARSLPAERPGKDFFIARGEKDRPLAYQMATGDPREALRALETLHACGADAVDLNMGCSAPEIMRAGGGAALMRDPPRARAVVSALRGATARPLFVKIRAGWEPDERALADFAKGLEDSGADLVAVHGRLCPERYGRPSQNRFIAAVVRAVSIPVVGNGDVVDGASARAMLAETGCAGVMVGRAAVARPWLLRDIAAHLAGELPPPTPDPAGVFARFVSLLAECLPEERRLPRLKEFTGYFARNFLFGHALWKAVQGSRSLEEALGRALGFLEPLRGEDRHGCREVLPVELGRHG